MRRSLSDTSKARGSMTEASTSRRRFTFGSWIPALMAVEFQRRMTTGGPIFTVKAPWCLRWASIGWSHSSRFGAYQLMTGPSGRYARYRFTLGSCRYNTRAAPTSSSDSLNHPRFSERHSFFTSAHAGTWQWLAEGRLWR